MKSLEGLLKIKVAACMPGTPFHYKTAPFGTHFGTQSGPKNYQKLIKKTRCENLQNICPKRPQNDPKMAPQIHPGSSKMVPKCLTGIGGTHFGSPSGSKVTPLPPNVPHRVSQGTPQVPPRASKQTYLRPQSLSWWPCGAPVCFWSVPLVRCFRSSWPLAPSIHQPIDLGPNNPSARLPTEPGRRNARSD